MRPSAQAKLGFYPTPDIIIERLRSWASPCATPQHGIFLDPCAGTGLPAKILAQAWNLTPWGIELDSQRIQEAKRHLPHCLHADGFQVHIPAHTLSALFLNPPYDTIQSTRSELLWLGYWTPKLLPHGLLCFIIPEPTVSAITKYLLTHYRQVHIYQFPTPHYFDFQQVIILGSKAPTPYLSEKTFASFKANSPHMTPFGKTPSKPFKLPSYPSYFLPNLFQYGEDPTTQSQDVRAATWHHPRIKSLLHWETTHSCRPLLPPRKGHTAQLLAAGFMNNEYLQTDTKQFLVKGRTVKNSVTLPDRQEDHRTISTTVERFSAKIQGWDLAPGPTYGQHLIIE